MYGTYVYLGKMIHTWYVYPFVVPIWYEVAIDIYPFGYLYATAVHLRLCMRSSIGRLGRNYLRQLLLCVVMYNSVKRFMPGTCGYPLAQLVRGSCSYLRSLDGVRCRGVPIIS